jgi:hypothetical protein
MLPEKEVHQREKRERRAFDILRVAPPKNMNVMPVHYHTSLVLDAARIVCNFTAVRIKDWLFLFYS